MLENLEKLKEGILSNIELDENGNERIVLENLTYEEKVALFLANGGLVTGSGDEKAFSLTGNMEKFPLGLPNHYCSLEDPEEKYNFIKELAEEYDGINKAIDEGRYEIVYGEDPETGEFINKLDEGLDESRQCMYNEENPCGPNCECYPQER